MLLYQHLDLDILRHVFVYFLVGGGGGKIVCFLLRSVAKILQHGRIPLNRSNCVILQLKSALMFMA